jgi:hypothetical protein
MVYREKIRTGFPYIDQLFGTMDAFRKRVPSAYYEAAKRSLKSQRATIMHMVDTSNFIYSRVLDENLISQDKPGCVDSLLEKLLSLPKEELDALGAEDNILKTFRDSYEPLLEKKEKEKSKKRIKEIEKELHEVVFDFRFWAWALIQHRGNYTEYFKNTSPRKRISEKLEIEVSHILDAGARAERKDNSKQAIKQIEKAIGKYVLAKPLLDGGGKRGAAIDHVGEVKKSLEELLSAWTAFNKSYSKFWQSAQSELLTQLILLGDEETDLTQERNESFFNIDKRVDDLYLPANLIIDILLPSIDAYLTKARPKKKPTVNAKSILLSELAEVYSFFALHPDFDSTVEFVRVCLLEASGAQDNEKGNKLFPSVEKELRALGYHKKFKPKK